MIAIFLNMKVCCIDKLLAKIDHCNTVERQWLEHLWNHENRCSSI